MPRSLVIQPIPTHCMLSEWVTAWHVPTANFVAAVTRYMLWYEVWLVYHVYTGELQGRLDYYLRTRLPSKVQLLRLTERTGLIRARLAGARAAVGSVLVFLDAHCEVVQNWWATSLVWQTCISSGMLCHNSEELRHGHSYFPVCIIWNSYNYYWIWDKKK